MKRIIIMTIALVSPLLMIAQPDEQGDTSWKKIHRASPTKINNLVHTKLDVKFDYNRSYLLGKAWITLQPHFYPTDTVTLDAKGMDIQEVSLVKGTAKSKLKYDYNGWYLKIWLDKKYTNTEKYTLYIDYIAKPDEVKQAGSAAITSAKGLYFINPKGTDTDKPVQIWTQGETEGSSVWFPTIDKPNQKTTSEIIMTVPGKYETLSNGALTSKKINADGTRTDIWKMELPHSPYLFFMGVGEFAVVKDMYKGKEVSYYVDKEYGAVARKIFGETPAMIALYERLLGVPYPWSKYAQMVGKDYVSGAMENTTATLHQEGAHQNARQLSDVNAWENTISHELFHQWFGDLVTAESWSNITMNESFAKYGEVLWQEYKYGKEGMDDHLQDNRLQYFASPEDAQKDLVRFHYRDKEEVFDLVSYQKGGAIIHMLRNYVGDDAFFKSLNKYLTDNRFKNGESHNLRLAFEEVTGRDLNWFFDQWYFGAGHPKLKIDYNYESGKARVIVQQTQKTANLFKLPIAIDIYDGTSKKRHNVWIQNKIDTFIFDHSSKPTLINVDADKMLLAEKTDNKSSEYFVEQWKNAANYLDKTEAIDHFGKKKMPEIVNGLSDKFDRVRSFTLDKITQYKLNTPELLAKIEVMADKDPARIVKSKALEFLVKTNDSKYKPLYEKYVTDSSYSVAGTALDGLIKLDPSSAYVLSKRFTADAKGKLGRVIAANLIKNASPDDFEFLYQRFRTSSLSQEKFQESVVFAQYLAKVDNERDVRSGAGAIMEFRGSLPEVYLQFIDPAFKDAFGKVAKAKRAGGNASLAEYLEGLIK